MSIWVIADLHLSFGVPEKKMDIFGPQWVGYADRMRAYWLERVCAEDLVLIPGDISWAMTLEEAEIDLKWIDQLPGTKLMIKGNHDYWWHSYSKVQKSLPPSLHALQNNAFQWNGVSIGGARLWDTDEYNFDEIIDFQETKGKPFKMSVDEGQKIFKRELERLELSLQQLDQSASLRIAMTHYPPISFDLKPSRAAALLEKYKVQICVFGHLHSLKPGLELFGAHKEIRYYLTSCDFLQFKPLKIYPNGSQK